MRDFFDLTGYGTRTAVVNDMGESFSYDDLNEMCGRLREFIGPGKKKLVMVLARNDIGTLIGYLAALQSNNAVLLTDADLNDEILDNLIYIYRPDFVWRPQQNNKLAAFRFMEYELFEYAWYNDLIIHPSLSVLLSTSGRVGWPKMVRLTGEGVKSDACAASSYLNLTETDRTATTLPIYYSYGLSVINSNLKAGATLLLTGLSVVRDEFWKFFNREKGTSLSGVPYTYEVYKAIGFFEMDLSSLCSMIQVGGRLDRETAVEFAAHARKKVFNFFTMYGAAEATAHMTYLYPEYNIKKAGSIGKAIPGGKLWLVDNAGNTITEPYTEGALFYQGVNVMMGYAQGNQDLAKGDELGGILRTGDIAYFDGDGFFYPIGRNNNNHKEFNLEYKRERDI